MDDKYEVLGEFIEIPKKVKEARNNSQDGLRIYMEYKAGTHVEDTLEEFMNILMSVNSD